MYSACAHVFELIFEDKFIYVCESVSADLGAHVWEPHCRYACLSACFVGEPKRRHVCVRMLVCVRSCLCVVRMRVRVRVQVHVSARVYVRVCSCVSVCVYVCECW